MATTLCHTTPTATDPSPTTCSLPCLSTYTCVMNVHLVAATKTRSPSSMEASPLSSRAATAIPTTTTVQAAGVLHPCAPLASINALAYPTTLTGTTTTTATAHLTVVVEAGVVGGGGIMATTGPSGGDLVTPYTGQDGGGLQSFGPVHLAPGGPSGRAQLTGDLGDSFQAGDLATGQSTGSLIVTSSSTHQAGSMAGTMTTLFARDRLLLGGGLAAS